MEKRIELTVVVNTEHSQENIKAAIRKGLYYGLDVKHIAAPKDVTIEFKEEPNPFDILFESEPAKVDSKL